MQVVIEIPEEIYSRIELMDDEKTLPYSLRKAYLLIIICAITNGKILPKGHGDLIDRSKLTPTDLAPEPWYSPMIGYEEWMIDDAEVVIPADKRDGE